VHLLIADDYRDNAETMAALLIGASGVDSVDVAFDGLHAVRLADAHQPDIVFLDIEMPILGGVDAARAIQLAAHHQAPILVAMSGNPDSALAAQLAGIFNFVLSKPVSCPDLMATLEAAATQWSECRGPKR